MPASSPSMCPHCGQNAPIIYRGVVAYCSACQRQRPALIAPSVSYAGKVAGVMGWVVLVVGTCISLGLGLLFGALSTTAGLAFGIPLGILTLAVSLTLLLSGRKLRKSGEVKQREMRRRAVFALAQNRGGNLTANDAAAALDMPPPVADAFLTDLAKTEPEEVTVEIDDKGGIYYAFPRLTSGRPRSRIEDQPRVRVTGVPDTFESEGLEYDEPAKQQQRQKR